MKSIGIMVPAYNEEDVLEIFYDRITTVMDRLEQYNFNILFINDGSKDNTLQILKTLSQRDKRISYLSLSRNFGKEVAMAAGFDYIKGDAVIIMDADLQDPPELIPEMIEYWEQGYDDVYAKRKTRAGESWFKKITSYSFYRLLQRISRVQIQKDTGDFRLLDRRAVEALKRIRESQRYTKGMFSWIGFKKKEILFDRDPRAAGKTKWNYLKLIELAIEGITSFTITPLKIASYLGITVSTFSFIYMFIIVIKTLLWKESVKGYPSLMVVILFLGGVQLICLGIMGEYLGRIFNETKERPLYLIEEYYENEQS